MIKAFSKSVRQALAEVWPLYGAAFAMATALSVLWTTFPFILRNIGGSKDHVGYALAANMIGYLLFLLVAAAKLGHLNPRHATRGASAAMFVVASAMLVLVYIAVANERHGSPILIWTLIAASTLAGGAMSLYWPYLMSWVSADYEGAGLNRRLGTYNGIWSSAAILGPVIGGALVEKSSLSPIGVSAGSLAICFMLLLLAHDKSAGTATSSGSDNANEADYDGILLLRMKWMARISLFCSWLWFSVARTQFALLFTDRGFGEAKFGVLLATFGIFNFLTMTVAGRARFWHFKPVLLPAVQVALAVSVLLLILGGTLWVFEVSFVLMGCAFGFAYSSHLYYGACGSRKRSRQMSIHEVTISLGVIVGSGTGGYLAKHLGVYHPYWFAVIVLTLGFFAQTAICIFPGRKPDSER